MFNLFIKRKGKNEYSTIGTNNIYHAGDTILLGDEEWIVLDGDIIH